MITGMYVLVALIVLNAIVEAKAADKEIIKSGTLAIETSDI